jgi:hypothetical protein
MRPPTALAFACLLAAPLLAGCGSPAPPPADSVADGWHRSACDPDPQARLARNAQTISGLRGPERDVAGRIAAAFGDEVTSAGTVDVGRYEKAYATKRGYVLPDHLSQPLAYDYVVQDPAFSAETVRNAAVALGAPADQLLANEEYEGGGSLVQMWHGQHLMGTETSWHTGEEAQGAVYSLSVRVMYDLPADVRELPSAQLQDAAERFARCELDAEGLTAAAGYTHEGTAEWAYMVANATLARMENVIFSNPHPAGEHCPEQGRAVLVDVATAAIVSAGSPPCA